jgi:hypothetical protein
MSSYVVSRHFFRRRARASERYWEARGSEVKVVKAQRAPWRWLVIRTFNDG